MVWRKTMVAHAPGDGRLSSSDDSIAARFGVCPLICRKLGFGEQDCGRLSQLACQTLGFRRGAGYFIITH